MAKIIFLEVEDWELEFIKNKFPKEAVITSNKTLQDTPITPEEFATCEILSPFVYSQLSAAMLGKFPNLKYITTRSTGYDHVDLMYCKQKGIIVSNVPVYGVHAVAEHAFALMLAVSKKLIPSVERTKQGNFSSEGLTGFELFGKTLGVIGTGNIGRVVCTIALGFGMKVIAFNRHEDDGLKAKGVIYMNLEDVLGTSDIISLHLPYTKETHHMINMQNISVFKKGSIIINTARGGLVETQAILDGLEKGILAGAGLDVLEEELFIKEEREFLSTSFLQKTDVKTALMDHILLHRGDVVITPHNAFNSREGVQEILETTVKNIETFNLGKPQNIVGV